MKNYLTYPLITDRHQSGFGLIEVLVALVLGLLTTVAVMQIYVGFEGVKRTTSGGADAQVNAAVALYTIERDLLNSGYGMGLPGAMNCKVNAYNEKMVPTNFSFSFVPVEIIDGGAGGESDSIRILYSSKDTFALPTSITKDHPPTAANFFVSSVQGIEKGDLMIAWQAGKDCTLFQVTNDPDTNNKQAIHNNGLSDWNPPGGSNILPQPDGYTKGSILFNMGSLMDITYSVQNGKLSQSRFDTAANMISTMELVDHVINIQAEFGKDTDGDDIVDTWDAVNPISSAEWLEVKMVRIAVVAQSAKFEKAAGGVFVTNQDIKWPSSASSANQRTIKISGITDWKNYRYRVFETVIPLRNLMWGTPSGV